MAQYDTQYELPLNRTLEYILEFPPTPGAAEGEARPGVLWAASSGGDAAHPVLLTVRQPAGVTTWQLPYEVGDAGGSGGAAPLQLQRTLCPADTARAPDDSGCGAADEGEGEGAARGLSLHVSSSCAAQLLVQVEVRLTHRWRLPFSEPVTLAASLTAPQVVHYQFEEVQHSVRLELRSEDDVCVSVSVQDYSCPIAQSLADIGRPGLRMTMQRSAAVQLSRRQFPRGFVVVVLVQPSPAACGGAEAETGAPADWLWADAVLGAEPQATSSPARTKEFTVTIEAALTRAQYVTAIAVTAALFLAFYVAFGVLVLARRWPAWARLVRPHAAPALDSQPAATPPPDHASEGHTDGAAPPGAPPAGRRRRTSVDTFDSSDDSSSEEEEPPATTATTATTVTTATPTTPANGHTALDGGQGAFGLPARLRLAQLARRRERTLRARSDRYLYTLLTVAVFYALPVLQFVAVVKIILNLSGSLDICYYNFLCAHPAGVLSDFNHVLSNLGYLLLGALFALQVQLRRARRRARPRAPEYGIPPHHGLLSALGVAMMMVALLSATYHVCPNKINFQFDTAFMYVLAVLSMVKIYQSRHPDVNARAHATFGVLAVLMALVVWGVLGGGALFWGAWTVLHVFTFLLLSLRIYYVGQFRLEKHSLQEAARELRRGARPLYGARLAILLAGNALNWLLAIYGLVRQSGDFAGHMLQVLLGNTLLHMVSYLALKLAHRERLRWYAWCWLAGAAAAWAPALYFFVSGSSDWSTAPALSRHYNHHCMVLQFYDSHDLWHLLSAVALYCSFNAMLTWDDGLSALKKTDIPVF
ncbi:SID1 transmembrane family member 1 isoform X2 [Papilio machaon]|uniref:SID1 transmembrane family member 1 isoform X2 n=1 Tax=Papilio machaon TaxID=76193 RepID=UPI001E664628|nr:SID1 transmembrane family member 1 isoform X2 [Papilio machaon]